VVRNADVIAISRDIPRILVAISLALNGLLAALQSIFLRLLIHTFLTKDTLTNVIDKNGATICTGTIMANKGKEKRLHRYVQTTVKCVAFRSTLCPSYVTAGTTTTKKPNTQATVTILPTRDARHECERNSSCGQIFFQAYHNQDVNSNAHEGNGEISHYLTGPTALKDIERHFNTYKRKNCAAKKI